jgi:hypothetical protein
MRLSGAIILAICASWLFSQPACAEKRVALVIGNAAYQNVGHLANPINDAAAIAATFKKANFDVVDSRVNLSATEMRRVLREFGDKARDADIAVIYYAGHGIEVDGINYLIPVDAALERDSDVYDEAISLDRLLVAVEPVKQLRLIILDACRDNPFANTMKRTIASRSIGSGLAKVEPSNPNTMIAFAARAGSTASDGNDRNSPFAVALAQHLTKPGLDVRKAFGFVRDDVLKATSNKQEPFIYGSLGGNDVALVPVAPPVAAPPRATPAADPNAAIRRDYELAERVGTMEAWDFFISTYPDGFYAKLAQAQRNKLAAEEARAIASEKARLAAEQQARLAAEGAKAAEQARAAAQAKVAEEARIAAEKKKAQEDAKLAEAERAKAVALAKAEEEARIAAEKARKIEEAKAEQARIAAEKRKAQEEAQAAKAADADRAKAAADDARIARDKAAAPATNGAQDAKPIGALAALAPGQTGEATAKPAKPAAEDIPRLLQSELQRVGCYRGAIDGNWNAAAQKSLGLFNKSAGTTLDTKLASLDTLDFVRTKPAGLCPQICEHGYKAEDDHCTRITCEAGFELDDDDTCQRVKSKKPAAKQEGKPEKEGKPEERQPVVIRQMPNAPTGGNPELSRCGATSCSQALRGCMRKTAIMGADSSVCTTKYNSCLQTGSFNGRFCQHSGLARN